jgi:hypothetical protein
LTPIIIPREVMVLILTTAMMTIILVLGLINSSFIHHLLLFGPVS